MRHKKLLLKTVSFAATVVLSFRLFPVPALYADTKKQNQNSPIENLETKNLETENLKTENLETENLETETLEIETLDQSSFQEVPREIIEINNIEDFITFSGNCFLDSWSANKQIRLNADLDLTGTKFGTIPVFAGIFDGQGHKISGFSYNGDGYAAGLFRYIEQSALVQNLTLEGEINASDEKECIGGLCGVNYGTIRNCNFQGNVSGMTNVGGIAGVNEGTGTIHNCTASGRVTGYYSTGGIAGHNHGSLSSCTNRTCINNDTEWVEEDDEMGAGIFLSINIGESGVEFVSGVDTGGIAGYSDSSIIGCNNYGTIGYEHTGYHIGGIVGRQSGVVSACTNHGRIFGRKDVGGIIGQMEPYIEVDEAESLRGALNKLHDLVAKTIDDMQAQKNGLKQDFDSLAAYSRGAVDAGDALADQMADFLDQNIDQVQSASDRIRHIIGMLPPVFDQVYAAEENFSNIDSALHKVVDSLEDMKNILGDAAATDFDDVLKDLEVSREQIHAIIDTMKNSTTISPEQILQLVEGLEEMSNSISAVISDISAVSERLEQETLKTFQDLCKDLRDTINYLHTAQEFIKEATRRTKSIVDYLNGQPALRFSKLGEEFDIHRENLHGQLKGLSDSIQILSNHASDYSDVVADDLRAVNDQINIIINLLADNLTNYSELDIESLYEEVRYEEIDNIAIGKAAGCINKGIIKGDSNVGGIAGSMAINEEDPKDNAAGKVEYRIGRKYLSRCILTECINEGFVTAKKDGAGGIAGYMKHGIVADCESYGNIESTEGGYVGGICGESLTVIQHCYALCSVSGSKNVGGIAGFANTLTDCYAMVDCHAAIGRKGAIAGQTESYEDKLANEEKKVRNNYYVYEEKTAKIYQKNTSDNTTDSNLKNMGDNAGSELYGIDNISYAGIAEPISYEKLLTVTGLPAQFWHLQVVFRVEDAYLGTQEVGYGESLSELKFPEIPEKEGYYGVWPDCSDKIMVGNLMIDGVYKEDVTVVQSVPMQVQKGENQPAKPYALAERHFMEDTILRAEISTQTPPEKVGSKENVVYNISLENAPIAETETFAIRLYNPWNNAEVWGYQDGKWILQESKARGQYLQVDMTGNNQTFCVSERSSFLWIYAVCTAGCAGVVLCFILVKKAKKRHKHRKKNDRE